MNEEKQRDPHRYDDMLSLPHHVSSKHPPMSLYNRAAQFSPFAALTGYDAEVEEAGRMTEQPIELSEDERILLDERISIVAEHLPLPAIVTYFIPDGRKAGGRYATVNGLLKKVRLYEQEIVMELDGREASTVPIKDILAIDCELLRQLFGE